MAWAGNASRDSPKFHMAQHMCLQLSVHNQCTKLNGPLKPSLNQNSSRCLVVLGEQTAESGDALCVCCCQSTVRSPSRPCESTTCSPRPIRALVPNTSRVFRPTPSPTTPCPLQSAAGRGEAWSSNGLPVPTRRYELHHWRGSTWATSPHNCSGFKSGFCSTSIAEEHAAAGSPVGGLQDG